MADLARVAHDLRTPLGALRNALDAMRLNPGDPQTAAWARDIMDRQLAELTRLVDELAALARDEKKARL